MTSEREPVAERFTSLFLSHRHAISAMVASVIMNAADADDVLQETSLRMWRNFDQFEAGTNFVAWAAAFVRFSALNYYRKQRTDRRITFSDELVTLLAGEMQAASETIDSRREALRACLNRMPAKPRRLIEMRYEPGTTIKRMAEQLGRSVDSVYKSVSRAHQALVRCVRDKLASGRHA